MERASCFEHDKLPTDVASIAVGALLMAQYTLRPTTLNYYSLEATDGVAPSYRDLQSRAKATH